MASDLDARVLALFDHAPKRDRLHVRGRFRTCPVSVIDEAVPRTGRVLEVGCGHGLVSAYLALSAGGRDVTGVDIDARKIAVASHAQSHADPTTAHLHFEHTEAGSLPAGPWDAIVIVDVLYLLDRPDEQALLHECLGRLADDGVLVLKETDVVPRWKHWFAKAQEVVATKILRITAGSSLSFSRSRPWPSWRPSCEPPASTWRPAASTRATCIPTPSWWPVGAPPVNRAGELYCCPPCADGDRKQCGSWSRQRWDSRPAVTTAAGRRRLPR
jgi:2-polyprenyl-3-methyl-5-hydroxy-6-metoxy-1,4-benzoquinol methylase